MYAGRAQRIASREWRHLASLADVQLGEVVGDAVDVLRRAHEEVGRLDAETQLREVDVVQRPRPRDPRGGGGGVARARRLLRTAAVRPVSAVRRDGERRGGRRRNVAYRHVAYRHRHVGRRAVPPQRQPVAPPRTDRAARRLHAQQAAAPTRRRHEPRRRPHPRGTIPRRRLRIAFRQRRFAVDQLGEVPHRIQEAEVAAAAAAADGGGGRDGGRGLRVAGSEGGGGTTRRHRRPLTAVTCWGVRLYSLHDHARLFARIAETRHGHGRRKSSSVYRLFCDRF